MLLTMLALVACERFPYGRHDLVDLRIVGMAYEDGTARAFIWEGTEAWSAVTPTQVWSGDTSFMECPEGVDCAPAAGPWEATVVVASGEDSETGTLVVESEAKTPVIGGATVEWEFDVATVTLEAPESHVTRWMEPGGRLEETGAHTVEFSPNEDGLVPLVALTTDGLGGNGWTVVDVAVGDVGPTLQSGNRRLPLTNTPADFPESQVDWLAEVASADNVYGFVLDNLRPDDGSADVEGCGVQNGVWNPDSIIERACGLNNLVALTVALSGTVVP